MRWKSLARGLLLFSLQITKMSPNVTLILRFVISLPNHLLKYSQVVQSELELLLLSANVRLRSLSSEEKLLRDPDVDVKIRKHRAAKRFVPKRRQSKILEAAIEAKRKRAEMPTAVVLPPKPVGRYHE